MMHHIFHFMKVYDVIAFFIDSLCQKSNTYSASGPRNTKENVHLLREELESAKQKLSRAEARADEAEKMRATCEVRVIDRASNKS